MEKYNMNEELLLKEIDELNESEKLKSIVSKIKENALKMGASKFEYRIKSKESAIESYRSNKKEQKVLEDNYRTVILTNPDTLTSFNDVDSICDLIGIRIITDNTDDLFRISEYLKKEYNSSLSMDLISKPVIGFEYRAIHMYFSLNINEKYSNVPLEIQLKSFEMHHTWVGLHDTVYKNPKVNLYDGCNLLPTLFKIFEFNARIIKYYYINIDEHINFIAVDSIIDYNKELFEKYKEDIEKACFLFAKSIYYSKNENSNITEEELFDKFNEIKLNNTSSESPIHICGDRALENATFNIATNNF